MPSYTDQLGRTVFLAEVPQRIVSLVPSQTELLHTLGLGDAVKGITKFCIHPDEWFRHKVRIGGTKDLGLEKIHALRPDLIIANKEENDRRQVEELSLRYPVWISDVKTLPDALGMIRCVGELAGKGPEAKALAAAIERRFVDLKTALTRAVPEPTREIRVAYLIWRDPWMVAGGDTFIQDMLGRCGFTNVFRDDLRYPSIELGALADLDCNLLLLSSEPFPFREKHIREIRDVLPQAAVRLVDGQMFSWYGSRLLLAPAYFRNLQESPGGTIPAS
jgi:ABC-type Fe3+-hydroxamate transport system substrate-binding protein